MKRKIRWVLFFYDTLLYLFSCYFILVIYPSNLDYHTVPFLFVHVACGFACLAVSRYLFNVYGQIWRYAGPKEYIRLIAADVLGGLAFIFLRFLLPYRITFARAVCMITMSLLGCLMARHIYQLVYQKRMSRSRVEKVALMLLRILTGTTFADEKPKRSRVRIAIIGAGSIGTMLADELIQNPNAIYKPMCFVDTDRDKVGREIYGIPVLEGDESVQALLDGYRVQEVVFALPNVSVEHRKQLYDLYKGFGYKIKAYDYPTLGSDEDGKRQIHDFDIEDLLFRSANQFLSAETMAWYTGKKVMITGGGGSIGSELARQVAKCKPAQLVILDVYENGAYDIQQELRMKYNTLDLQVEIVSVCDKEQIDKIFREHTPDIVFHAAAHKHVPLMEKNVIEAVSNNVFGTLNVVEACERYGVKRFIMISTDKAVNPTNVMGATKRMCEMIVQSRGEASSISSIPNSCECEDMHTGERSERAEKPTSFSATRFGNVLGSNGSVIPLFKRQIAGGGPVTITDKRVIRYFMTIPEATQLVMTSGAMAGNGELYVLDMGKPVRILDLAESMIRLSGFEPYQDIDIVEIGLRPGEKLYEELLIKTEELDKTENDMIFVERDKACEREEIDRRLDLLKKALESKSNKAVREALMQAVPTYHAPEEVNRMAIASDEMKSVDRGHLRGAS